MLEAVGSSRDVVGAAVVEVGGLVVVAAVVVGVEALGEEVVDGDVKTGTELVVEAGADVVVEGTALLVDVVLPWVVEVVDGTLELEDVVVTFHSAAANAGRANATEQASATDRATGNAMAKAVFMLGSADHL